jgi:predicted Rossmann fold nucleotide-binding protein DprA/Smf involved in DNA uptake
LRAAWINLGSKYMLMDDCGAHRGTIITLDKQTYQRSLRALYDPPVVIYTEGSKLLHKGDIDRKTA